MVWCQGHFCRLFGQKWLTLGEKIIKILAGANTMTAANGICLVRALKILTIFDAFSTFSYKISATKVTLKNKTVNINISFSFNSLEK
jgi:hypothetical protein